MRRGRRLRAAVSLFAIPAACACAVSCGLDIVGGNSAIADAGLVDGSGPRPEDGSLFGDASADGPCALQICDQTGSCAAGAVCTPAVPAGWHVLTVGDNPASTCGTGYEPFGPAAKKVTSSNDGGGGGAACTCTCAKTSDGQCSGGAVNLSWSDNLACTKFLGTILADTQCRDIPDGGITTAGQNFSLQVIPVNALPVCAAAAVTPNIPSIDGGEVRACRPTNASPSCEQNHRLCIPAPAPGLRTCIATDLVTGGPTICPAGYQMQPQPFTAATALADNRACGPCACGPTPVACNVDVNLYASSNCGGASVTKSSAPSTCSAFQTASGISQLYQTAKLEIKTGSPAGGSCVKTVDSQLTGTAGATGGYVVCCSN